MIPTNFKKQSTTFVNELSKLQSIIAEIEKKISNEAASNQLLKEHPISDEISISIEKLKKDLDNLDIKLNLCVFGKFNSGKSSFINALLGKEVAVVDELEMTYSLNYITYGPEEKGKILNTDSTSIQMSIKELNNVILAKRLDPLFRDKIDTVELTFPYDEIKDINIWDTPGLGSTTIINRDKALSIIDISDVILWIIDVENIGDADDNYYIKMAQSLNKPIICIVNKMDLREEPEAKERILQFIEDIYSSSFSATFLVSSKRAHSVINQEYVRSQSGISEVKNYLETNVFKKKQEIIIGSISNSLRNGIHNIQSQLNQFKDKLEEHIQRYGAFCTELESRTNAILPDIQSIVNSFVASEVFEDEYHSILSKINLTPINSHEDLDKIISETITESRTEKYIDSIYKLIKSRIESNWNTAIVQSSDLLTPSDKYFHISNSSLLTTSESESLLKGEVVNDLAIKVGTIAGSITSVAMIATGTAFFTSIFSGALVFGGVVWGIFKIARSSNDQMQSIRKILKEKIDDLKKKFDKEIIIGMIMPRVEQSQIQMKEQILKEAETKIFNNATVDDCRSIISKIVSMESMNDTINVEIDLLYDSIAKDNEIFQRKTELKDFIIERENPNPGIERLIKILSTASQYVYFIDPYFQEKSLAWLRHVNPHVTIKVLLYYLDEQFDQHPSFINKLSEIREQRSAALLVRMIRYKNQKGTPLHDRFIFTRNWCVQLGNGLDAIGKQDISISFIQDNKMFLDKYFNKYWDATSIRWVDKERPVIKLDL